MAITITPQVGSAGMHTPATSAITVNTKSRSNPVLDKIKARFGEPSKMLVNKQGQAIPPQPSGAAVNAQPRALQAQIPTENIPNVETKAAAEDTSKPLEPQYAALARQERALREARRQFQADKDKFQQERSKYVSKDLFQSDPLKALSEANTSYEKLVELQLQQAPQDPQQVLLDKITALEAKLASTAEGLETSLKTRDQQAYEQAKKQIQSDVDLLVNSDPTYETLKATGQSKEVTALIEKVFNEEGIILDVEDAAKAIEDVAFEKESKRLEDLQKLSKFKARLGQAQAAMSGQEAIPAKPGSSSTITNSMGSTRPLSPRERAILAFEKAKTS